MSPSIVITAIVSAMAGIILLVLVSNANELKKVETGMVKEKVCSRWTTVWTYKLNQKEEHGKVFKENLN